MASLDQLIKDVAAARAMYVSDVSQLTDQQAAWKPADDVWSAVDNTEHLFWAEQGGILGMWLEFLRFHLDRHRNQVVNLRRKLG